jgi:hypothetical protein
MHPMIKNTFQFWVVYPSENVGHRLQDLFLGGFLHGPEFSFDFSE